MTTFNRIAKQQKRRSKVKKNIWDVVIIIDFVRSLKWVLKQHLTKLWAVVVVKWSNELTLYSDEPSLNLACQQILCKNCCWKIIKKRPGLAHKKLHNYTTFFILENITNNNLANVKVVQIVVCRSLSDHYLWQQQTRFMIHTTHWLDD